MNLVNNNKKLFTDLKIIDKYKLMLFFVFFTRNNYIYRIILKRDEFNLVVFSKTDIYHSIQNVIKFYDSKHFLNIYTVTTYYKG